jgi:hypothetical protein
LNRYKEDLDRIIIKIIHKINREITFGELEYQFKQCVKSFSYKTYSGRLKQLCETSKNNKQARYVIQPVLQKRDDGRGKNTFYSLTKNARIRCDLKLPILKSDALIEKAYRILYRSLAFENSLYRKFKDVNEYNAFLQKLGINENELRLDGKPGYNNKDFYKVSKWIHLDSGIKISSIEYLEGSDNYGKSEYSYQLPGISIKEFIKNNESEKSKGLAYGHLDFKEDDEVNKYFKLLEDRRLIEKVIRSRYLTILNEEDRYIFVDNTNNKEDTNKLKEFFKECWLLHGRVTIYLYQKWKSIQKPTREERIWCEHFWGNQRTNQILIDCDKERVKLNKRKNQKDKQDKEDIQKLLNSLIIGLKKKFELIQKTYSDIIENYSYLINPLLNSIYPQFLRN